MTGVSGSGADRSLIHSDERLVAHFDADQQHLVERVEHRDLQQDRQAAGGRVDLLLLVELHDLLLLALALSSLKRSWIAFIFGWILRIAAIDWNCFCAIGNMIAAHDQGQADDRHAEIADRVEQAQQQAEDRPS